MENGNSTLEMTWEHVRNYCRTKVRLEVLKAVEKFSEMSSKMIYWRIIGFTTLFCLAFGSVGLALYISTLSGHFYVGFFAVTGGYILLLLLLLGIKRKLRGFIQERVVTEVLKYYPDEQGSGTKG